MVFVVVLARGLCLVSSPSLSILEPAEAAQLSYGEARDLPITLAFLGYHTLSDRIFNA